MTEINRALLWVFAGLAVIVVILLLTQQPAGAASQTAKVVEISIEDTLDGRLLYNNLLDAQAAWDIYVAHLGPEYVQDPMPDGIAVFGNMFGPLPAPGHQWKPGWEKGFELSEDLKFLVPRTRPAKECWIDGIKVGELK